MDVRKRVASEAYICFDFTQIDMCLFNSILIPTDFSPAAWNAVKLAAEMCKENNSEITLLHIYPSKSKFDFKKESISKEDQQTIKSIEKQMNAFCDQLRLDRKLNLNSVILGGWVDVEILEYINKNNFDLIIMGVNSNGLNNRPGSHLYKIIEKATAPVMVIPNTPSYQRVVV